MIVVWSFVELLVIVGVSIVMVVALLDTVAKK